MQSFCLDVVEHLNLWLLPIFKELDRDPYTISVTDLASNSENIIDVPIDVVYSKALEIRGNPVSQLQPPELGVFNPESYFVISLLDNNADVNDLHIFISPAIKQLLSDDTYDELSNLIQSIFKSKLVQESIGPELKQEPVIELGTEFRRTEFRKGETILRAETNLFGQIYTKVVLPILLLIVQNSKAQFRLDLTFSMNGAIHDIDTDEDRQVDAEDVKNWIHRTFGVVFDESDSEEFNAFIKDNFLIGIPNVFEPGSIEFTINTLYASEWDMNLVLRRHLFCEKVTGIFQVYAVKHIRLTC